MSQKVAGCIAWLSAGCPGTLWVCEGCFRSLKLSLHGLFAGKGQHRDIRYPQRGSCLEHRRRQRLKPVQDLSTRATKVQRHARSLDQVLGARKIIGGSSMLKRFDLQAMRFIPLTGTLVQCSHVTHCFRWRRGGTLLQSLPQQIGKEVMIAVPAPLVV